MACGHPFNCTARLDRPRRAGPPGHAGHAPHLFGLSVTVLAMQAVAVLGMRAHAVSGSAIRA